MKNIAIIGAGLSGLVLGNALKSIANVSIFELEPDVGGRMASRYYNPFFFNYGAQAFTVRSIDFQQFLTPYIREGVVTKWQPRIFTLSPGESPQKKNWTETHYTSFPDMNSLSKILAKECDVHLSREVLSIKKEQDKWKLLLKGNISLHDYDWVIVTTPAARAAEILQSHSTQASVIKKARMSACFALMLGFSKPLNLPFEAALVKNSLLGWIAAHTVNQSQRGKILLQTTNNWAQTHISENPEQIQVMMRQALSELLEVDFSQCNFDELHCWDYAGVDTPLSVKYVLDTKQQLAACGDWCIAGRVEAAFLSAHYLSEAISSIIS